MSRMLRAAVATLFVTALIVSFALAQPASAQDEPDGFPLVTNAAFCEPGHAGPLVGCVPWEGLTVTVTSSDGLFSASCTTVAGSADARSASCLVYPPFGSYVTASIDAGSIPAGYELGNALSQEFQIPDGPPEGQFGGPVYLLYAISGENGGQEPGDGNGGTPPISGLPDTGAGPMSANTAFYIAIFTGALFTLVGVVFYVRQSRHHQ